jgi:hypothetical protein
MIDVKEAVQIAKGRAAEMLGPSSFGLEEIEREGYKGHEVWSITLSYPRDLSELPHILRVGTPPLHYKRFLIDGETGELVAMKIREPASQ